MLDIQNISITSTQTVPQPKPHTTYTIQSESCKQIHHPVHLSLPTSTQARLSLPQNKVAPTRIYETQKLTWIVLTVSTPTRTWTVSRRYNDFTSLHAELLSSIGKPPPVSLPPKHPWSLTRSAYDEKVGLFDLS